MRRFGGLLSCALTVGLLLPWLGHAGAPLGLKLIAPAGYFSHLPVLIRVEALDPHGGREVSLWDAEVELSTDSGAVSLSTNRVTLRNGLGSSLVRVRGGGAFRLSAALGPLQASRTLIPLEADSVNAVGGALPNGEVVWSGVVRVTNTVIVRPATTLTILSNTVVLLTGATSNAGADSLIVGGRVRALGTETEPITLTSASSNATWRWGQIRHTNAPASIYRHTIFTRGGRVSGEGGHTGQGPVVRSINSTLAFEHCSLTDHAEPIRGVSGFGTPGKIALANGSDLTFVDCLFQRSRMGPEITGTALLCTNTWMLDMRGPDDADGIYLHGQGAGQQVLLSGCVLAGGDDDGVDTLGAEVEVENCILRDWNSALEDAKGISVFNGQTHVRRSLIVDSTVGIAAKWSGGDPTLVTVNACTLVGNLTNVLAQRKDATGPFIDYRITNSILWGGDPVQSDFAETNFTIRYCDLEEPWPGEGNLMQDPRLGSVAAREYGLGLGSPCIDAGNPAYGLDPDGSRADIGYRVFVPPAPQLRAPTRLTDGSFQWRLEAYPNRNYVIEFSTNGVSWGILSTVFPEASSTEGRDPTIDAPVRFYRVRWGDSP